MKIGWKKVWVVCGLLVHVGRGDFLNEYLNAVTIGSETEGPCPEFEERCIGSFENLSQSVKDISVCITDSLCSPIGDLVESGTAEIWHLTCRNIGIQDIDLTRQSTAETLISSSVDLENIQLACSMRINVYNFVLTLGSDIRVELELENVYVEFPYDGNAGRIDAGVLFNLATNAPAETFLTDLPAKVTLPADECNVEVALGINLEFEQLKSLTLCARAPGFLAIFGIVGFQCADVIDPNSNTSFVNWLLGTFNIDNIIGIVIRLLEAVIGGIVCQVIEELAVLEDGRDGVINEVLTEIKDQVEDWATSPTLNPADYDNSGYILGNDLASPAEFNAATNFADSTLFQALSAGINGWLSGPSSTPGYDLVINELIDQITEPDGTIDADLVDLELAPEVLLPLQFTNATVTLKRIALTGLNTFRTFQLLQLTGSPTLQHTFRNAFDLDAVSLQVDVATKLRNGDWVTAGTGQSDFSFTFSLALENLMIDMSNLVLVNPSELVGVKIGQITQLLDVDLFATGEDFVTNALQCFAPALYTFNFTNLEASLGAIGDADMLNFDGEGLSELIVDGVDLVADALRGALKEKLPGIARSVIRETANQLLAEYVTIPGRAGTNACPPWGGPTGTGPTQIDFTSGIFANVAELIDKSIGGQPIKDTGTDVNELVDAVLEGLIGAFVDVPIERQAQGQWHLTQEATDALRATAFQRPNDYFHITDGGVSNLNSVYELSATPLAVAPTSPTGGVQINFGIGGPMQGVVGPVPLRLSIDFDIDVPSRGVNKRDQFSLVLDLTEIQAQFALGELWLRTDYLNELSVLDVTNPICMLGTLDTIKFVKSLEALTVGGLNLLVDRDVESTGSLLDNALESISSETPGQTFVNLVNTILKGSLSAGLDVVESVPQYFEGAKALFCALFDPFASFKDSVLNLPNFTEFAEECLESVDFATLPPVGQVEDEVLESESTAQMIDEKAFMLTESDLFSVVSTVLNSALGGSGQSNILNNLANSTLDSFVTNLFEFDAEDPTKINMVVPLDILGLRYESDTIIPGLVLDPGTFRLKSVNVAFDKLTLLEPVEDSRFSTRQTVRVTPNTAINATITAFVEMDKHAIDPNVPLGTETIREEIELELELEQFFLDVVMMTAIDSTKLDELSLGHFVTFDENQNLLITDNALDCFMAMLLPKGFHISKFQLDIGNTMPKFALRTVNHVLFSEGYELSAEAIAELFVYFYKDAASPIVQNCLRVMANDFFVAVQRSSFCPRLENILPTPLTGKDALFRFDGPVWEGAQGLLSSVLEEDNYVNLNAALRSVLDNSKFLESVLGDQFSGSAPFAFLGYSYGLIDVTLSNVQLTGLEFSELVLASAPITEGGGPGVTATNSPYVTKTKITMPGTTTLEFDLQLDAKDVFPEQPNMKNDLHVEISLTDFGFMLLLNLQVDVNEAIQLPFRAINSLDKLPCILIPIKAVEPLDFNVTLSELNFASECQSECDFPLVPDLNSLKFETSNGEQLAALVQRALQFLTEYLTDINAQAFVNLELLTAAQQCDSLLDDLSNLFSPDLESPEYTLAIGMTTLGLCCLGGVIGFIVTARNRKHSLQIAAAHDDPTGTTDDSKMAELLFGSFMSVYKHPRVGSARLRVPIATVVVLALGVLAIYPSKLFSLVSQITIFGAETTMVTLVPFEVPFLVDTLWAQAGWFIAVLLILANIVVPAFQGMMLLSIWFIPNGSFSMEKKRKQLFLLQATGKISFALLFITVILHAALYTQFSLADYRNTNFLATDLFELSLMVKPDRGIILLMICGASNLGLAIYADIVLRRLATPPKALEPYRNVRQPFLNHRFGNRELSPRLKPLLCISGVLSMIIISVAVWLPVITLEIRGLLGLVMKEISLNSPTIPESNPLHISTFSYMGLGAMLDTAPQRDFVEIIFSVILKVMFYVLFVCIPIFVLGLMVFIVVKPTSTRTTRILLNTLGKLSFWAAMDIGLIVLAGMIFLSDPMVSTFANWIVTQVAGRNICVELAETVLPFLVQDEEDGVCMTVLTSLDPAVYTMLLFGWLLGFTALMTFLIIANAIRAEQNAKEHQIPVKHSHLTKRVLRKWLVPAGAVRESTSAASISGTVSMQIQRQDNNPLYRTQSYSSDDDVEV